MTDLYFAHSMNDYDTEYERASEKLINYITGNRHTIINPKDVTTETINKALSVFDDTPNKKIIFWREMCNVFFPMIYRSDVFACVPDNISGKYSSGVSREIYYAKNIGITILEIPHIDKYIIDELGWSNEFSL